MNLLDTNMQQSRSNDCDSLKAFTQIDYVDV